MTKQKILNEKKLNVKTDIITKRMRKLTKAEWKLIYNKGKMLDY